MTDPTTPPDADPLDLAASALLDGEGPGAPDDADPRGPGHPPDRAAWRLRGGGRRHRPAIRRRPPTLSSRPPLAALDSTVSTPRRRLPARAHPARAAAALAGGRGRGRRRRPDPVGRAGGDLGGAVTRPIERPGHLLGRRLPHHLARACPAEPGGAGFAVLGHAVHHDDGTGDAHHRGGVVTRRPRVGQRPDGGRAGGPALPAVRRGWPRPPRRGARPPPWPAPRAPPRRRSPSPPRPRRRPPATRPSAHRSRGLGELVFVATATYQGQPAQVLVYLRTDTPSTAYDVVAASTDQLRRPRRGRALSRTRHPSLHAEHGARLRCRP